MIPHDVHLKLSYVWNSYSALTFWRRKKNHHYRPLSDFLKEFLLSAKWRFSSLEDHSVSFKWFFWDWRQALRSLRTTKRTNSVDSLCCLFVDRFMNLKPWFEGSWFSIAFSTYWKKKTRFYGIRFNWAVQKNSICWFFLQWLNYDTFLIGNDICSYAVHILNICAFQKLSSESCSLVLRKTDIDYITTVSKSLSIRHEYYGYYSLRSVNYGKTQTICILILWEIRSYSNLLLEAIILNFSWLLSSKVALNHLDAFNLLHGVPELILLKDWTQTAHRRRVEALSVLTHLWFDFSYSLIVVLNYMIPHMGNLKWRTSESAACYGDLFYTRVSLHGTHPQLQLLMWQKFVWNSGFITFSVSTLTSIIGITWICYGWYFRLQQKIQIVQLRRTYIRSLGILKWV